MPDPRAVYARRYVDRITLRPSGLYWPTVGPVSTVESRRPATVVDAWWEMLSLPPVTRRDVA